MRQGPRYRTQSSFIGSPVVADLDGNGGRPEIIAAGDGSPRLRVGFERRPGAGLPGTGRSTGQDLIGRPADPAPTFNASAGAELNQGAIIDTPAVGDLDGDGRPEIVVGTNEEYKTADDGGLDVGNLNAASLAVLARPGS